MKRKLHRFGGNSKGFSVGITIPKQIVELFGFKVGDEFEIKSNGSSLTLSPVPVSVSEEN